MRRREHPADQRTEQQPARGKPRNDDNRQANQRIHAPELEHPEGAVGTQHDELAMRKIDDARHAERKGEADRHQRIQATQKDGVNEKLECKAHVLPTRAYAGPRHAGRASFAAKRSNAIYWTQGWRVAVASSFG